MLLEGFAVPRGDGVGESGGEGAGAEWGGHGGGRGQCRVRISLKGYLAGFGCAWQVAVNDLICDAGMDAGELMAAWRGHGIARCVILSEARYTSLVGSDLSVYTVFALSPNNT